MIHCIVIEINDTVPCWVEISPGTTVRSEFQLDQIRHLNLRPGDSFLWSYEDNSVKAIEPTEEQLKERERLRASIKQLSAEVAELLEGGGTS